MKLAQAPPPEPAHERRRAQGWTPALFQIHMTVRQPPALLHEAAGHFPATGSSCGSRPGVGAELERALTTIDAPLRTACLDPDPDLLLAEQPTTEIAPPPSSGSVADHVRPDP